MLSDDLVAGAPVTIAVRKGRKRPCCQITPARPQPARSAKGRETRARRRWAWPSCGTGKARGTARAQRAPPRTSHWSRAVQTRSPITSSLSSLALGQTHRSGKAFT